MLAARCTRRSRRRRKLPHFHKKNESHWVCHVPCFVMAHATCGTKAFPPPSNIFASRVQPSLGRGIIFFLCVSFISYFLCWCLSNQFVFVCVPLFLCFYAASSLLTFHILPEEGQAPNQTSRQIHTQTALLPPSLAQSSVKP